MSAQPQTHQQTESGSRVVARSLGRKRDPVGRTQGDPPCEFLKTTGQGIPERRPATAPRTIAREKFWKTTAQEIPGKKPNWRCGAPDGNRNALKHGRYAKEMRAVKAEVRELIRRMKFHVALARAHIALREAEARAAKLARARQTRPAAVLTLPLPSKRKVTPLPVRFGNHKG